MDTDKHMPHLIALPAAVTIETVQTLADELKATPPGAVLSLDAAVTEILTTPGMQLLLTLEKNLASTGGRFSLINVRDAVAANFRTLGLTEKFAEWSAHV